MKAREYFKQIKREQIEIVQLQEKIDTAEASLLPKAIRKEWKQMAAAIKEAAGWKCQKCGKQCRRPGDPFDTHKNTLTVAHLNHIPEDMRPENLLAMCAPCHLRYDAKHHAETRRRNRERNQKRRLDKVQG